MHTRPTEKMAVRQDNVVDQMSRAHMPGGGPRAIEPKETTGNPETETYGLSRSFLESLSITLPLVKEVLVCNLDSLATEEDVKELFSVAGSVIKVQHNPGKGQAIVEMGHQVEAVQSVSMLHSQEYFDKIIIVRLLKPNDPENLVTRAVVPSVPRGLKSIGKGLGLDGLPVTTISSINKSSGTLQRSQDHQQRSFTARGASVPMADEYCGQQAQRNKNREPGNTRWDTPSGNMGKNEPSVSDRLDFQRGEMPSKPTDKDRLLSRENKASYREPAYPVSIDYGHSSTAESSSRGDGAPFGQWNSSGNRKQAMDEGNDIRATPGFDEWVNSSSGGNGTGGAQPNNPASRTWQAGNNFGERSGGRRGSNVSGSGGRGAHQGAHHRDSGPVQGDGTRHKDMTMSDDGGWSTRGHDFTEGNGHPPHNNNSNKLPSTNSNDNGVSTVGRELILANLPSNTRDDGVRELCSRYGTVRGVQLNMTHRTGRIIFLTYQQANMAADMLNNQNFNGSSIKAMLA